MKLLPLVILILFGLSAATADADISVQVEPTTINNQLWAFETYSMNFTIHDLNLTHLTPKGNITYHGNVKWRGIGQYHHGESVTGYSYNLDQISFSDTSNTSHPHMVLNLTLTRDNYLFGMKPYETIDITVSVEASIITSNTTGGTENVTIASFNHVYNLIDYEKVEYLEEKMGEMTSDVNLVTSTLGVESFNKSKYMAQITEMNASLQQEDYAESLDLWTSWDNRDRYRMFHNLINHVNERHPEYESLKTMEQDHEILLVEYEALEGKYLALLSSNKNTIAELDTAKTGLSTAITGVFLAAILFFFLGRNSGKEVDL